MEAEKKTRSPQTEAMKNINEEADKGTKIKYEKKTQSKD